LAKAGAAVLVIDHLSKGADSRNFGPVGTAAKRRAIGGVSLRVTVKDAFTPGSGGAAYLKVNKDRHGGLREHCPTGDREPLAGTFIMRVFGDALTGEIKAADGTENVTDDHALSASQARDVAADVALLDALDPPPQSRRDVCQRMTWGTARAQSALSAWRESTGQAAPKNQHEDGPSGSGRSAGTGTSTPYVSGPPVPAPTSHPKMGLEQVFDSKSAGTPTRLANATVIDIESRRPPCPKCESGTARPDTGRCDFCTRKTMTAGDFLVSWFRHHTRRGEWVQPLRVYQEAEPIGWNRHTVMTAKNSLRGVIESSSRGRGSEWRLDPASHTNTEDAS